MPEQIAIDDLTLTVEHPATASRAPILFVHGLNGGAWYFEAYQRFFADRGHPAYALNLRGHHGSRPVPDLGRVSVLDYAADAIEARDELRQRHHTAPIVVGHSLGGLVTQKAAESGGFAAAVLLCSAPPHGISIASPTLLLRQLKPRYLLPMLLSRPIEGTYEDLSALAFGCIPPERRRALFERFVPDSGRVAREISLGTIRVDEGRVRCPVLSVGAARDKFVVPRIARRLARKYGAEHLEFAGHAHLIMTEPDWETPAAAIDAWIDRTLGAA